MCAKFGCGPTIVPKKGVYKSDRQTDKVTLQLYIVEEQLFTVSSATKKSV